MKSIAIAIICKNESSHAPEILQNTLAADHIYILDTGSTDGTFDKLQQFRLQLKIEDKVTLLQKEFPEVHFSDFRNFLHRKVSSDFDYILYLDMDERLPNNWRSLLNPYLEQNPSKVILFRKELPGQYITPLERVFLNRPGNWVRPLHEHFHFQKHEDERQTPLKAYDFHFEHNTNNSVEKKSLYLSIIQQNMQKDPQNYLYFYLEHIFTYEKDCTRYLKEYYDRKVTIETLAPVYRHLLCRYALMARIKDHLPIDQELFDYFLSVPNKSVYFNASIYFLRHGEKQKAQELFQTFLTMKETDENRYITFMPNAYDPIEIEKHQRNLQ